MREYTIEELVMLSLDELYDIRQAKISEQAAAQNKRVAVINDIIAMQQQVQVAYDEVC